MTVREIKSSEKEKIVCGAIAVTWLDNERERDSIFLGVYYEKIQSNEFYRSLCDSEVILGEKRGFITNRNRFVEPREAMGIAIDAGQIPYLKDLFDKYHYARVNNPNTGVSCEAKIFFSAFDHQRRIWECKDLKPEDLY